jgi:hypothetical protein
VRVVSASIATLGGYQSNLVVMVLLFYGDDMRCSFEVDGDRQADWTEDRHDLPLYVGGAVDHNSHAYEIIEGPDYRADWATSAVTAHFLVKPAPTTH